MTLSHLVTVLVLGFVDPAPGPMPPNPPAPKPDPAKAKVDLPETLTVAPGRQTTIAATTAGKCVKWSVETSAAGPTDLAVCKGHPVAIFSAPNPGTYVVHAWTAVGDEPSDMATCTVTVQAPPPPPPSPNDPLVQKLVGAYKAAPDPDALKDLVTLYGLAVSTANDKSITTLEAMLAKVATAGKTMLGGKLQGLRQAIADELAAEFGDPSALTDDLRAKLAQAYAKIQVALQQIK